MLNKLIDRRLDSRRIGLLLHVVVDDSFMKFYDISHERSKHHIIAGLDLNYDRVQPTEITHSVKSKG